MIGVGIGMRWLAIGIGLVAVQLGSTEAARAAPCRVGSAAASFPRVTVPVPGRESIELRLEKVRLVAVPDVRNTTRLQVMAPLRFDIPSMPSKEVRWKLRKKVALFGGRLRLSDTLTPTLSTVKGGNAIVAAPLGGIEVKGDVAIPCASLTVDDSEFPADTPTPNLADETVTVGETRDFVPLYRTTKEVDPIWVKFSFTPTIILKHNDWVRVEQRWSDDSVLEGWVPARYITLTHAAQLGTIGHGIGGRGGCGRSHAPQRVTLSIRKNAAVADAPGGVVWARTASKIEVEALTIYRSDGWVQIAAIKGLPPKPCSEHDRFWVHVNDVVWPKPTYSRP